MDKNPPAGIGEILQQMFPTPPLGKQLRPKLCPECNKVRPLGLFGVCLSCHRSALIEALPVDEQEFLISQIIPPKFMGARFEHLSDRLQAKIKLLDSKGLLLWGAPGVGKTYAMAALAREYILQGALVARIGYELLCLRIRDTFKQIATETEWTAIKPYLETDKLFIEDIGAGKSEKSRESEWSIKTLTVILDYRLENCLPTFCTTNRPIEELSKTFDQRIASRLIEMCEIVKLTGEDRRK